MKNKDTIKKNSVSKSYSRRDFLRTSAAASAAFTIIPNIAMGKTLGHQAPSDTLNIALVGAGGQGNGDIRAICKPEIEVARTSMVGGAIPGGMTMNAGNEKLVAICDVDWGYNSVLECFKRFPSAAKYKDWRVMFDEMESQLML